MRPDTEMVWWGAGDRKQDALGAQDLLVDQR